MTPDINKPLETKVWDLGVRIFHWVLVTAVVIAAYTGFFGRKNQIDIHVIAGVTAATLVIFRLIWGATGSTYSRFSSFVVSPNTALRHFGELRCGTAHRHIGHNPLGAWMIVALLTVLTVIAITGVITLGGFVKEGPLASFTPFSIGLAAREVHEIGAIVLATMVVFHLIGVVYESLRTRENLTRAMVTGRKRCRPDDEQAVEKAARPVLAFGILTAIALPTAASVMHYSAKPALGVPTAAIDATYRKECGACHSVHHPTVAPAATWRAIFADLKSHFGDDASLDPAKTNQLLTYAIANSSEQWDTAVANAMRQPSTEQPLRITEAPIWKHIHGHFPDTLFKSKPIGGKLNCSNCHRDAETGVFAPRNISIKREPKI